MRVFAMTGFGNLKAKSGLSVLAVLNSYLGSSPEQLAPDGQPYNQACILGLPTFTNYWGRTTTCSDGGGPYWGRDQRGVPVSNVDDWQAAVALIRSWAGHDPAQASSFAYPPPWWMLDFNQNEASKADPTTGSTAATIAGLEAALGIRPLAVLHQGCGTYAFSSIDPSSSVYWGEHWVSFLCVGRELCRELCVAGGCNALQPSDSRTTHSPCRRCTKWPMWTRAGSGRRAWWRRSWPTSRIWPNTTPA